MLCSLNKLSIRISNQRSKSLQAHDLLEGVVSGSFKGNGIVDMKFILVHYGNYLIALLHKQLQKPQYE
jgi:hypothetical protein